LLDATKVNLGSNPDEVSADAGTARRPIFARSAGDGSKATSRPDAQSTEPAITKRPAKPGSLLARMTTKLRRAGHRSRYRLRKQVVEPVFGQIKQAMGFRQFLLPGIEKVKAE
jgi:hypothetical protein